MGKRNRVPPLEELLERPWCYYCERDFDDLKVLTDHQKAKHFKCDRCNRRLNTIGGLAVHQSQVHKEQLTGIENCIPSRNDINHEIYGMEGVPEEALQARRQAITTEYFKKAAQHRAESGNPLPGSDAALAMANKKPKIEAEDKASLKARLAEHRAKKAAEKAAQANASVTPDPLAGGTAPSAFEPPVRQESSAGTPAAQQPDLLESLNIHLPPGGPVAGFGSPGFNPPQPAQYAVPPGPVGAPYQPYGAYQYSPSTVGGFPNQPAFNYQHGFAPTAAGSPPFPLVSVPSQVPASRAPIPVQTQSQSSLPKVPGLPQRPSFNTPKFSDEEMAKIHNGQTVSSHLPPRPNFLPQNGVPSSASPAPYATLQQQITRADVDDLIDAYNPNSEAPPDDVQKFIDSLTNPQAPTNLPHAAPTPHSQAPPAATLPPVPLQAFGVASTDHSGAENGIAQQVASSDTPALSVPPPAHSEPQLLPGTMPLQSNGAEKVPVVTNAATKATALKSKSKRKLTRQVYTDSALSPEEKRAHAARYKFENADEASKLHTETVLSAEGSDAVTGPVDAVLEGQ